MSSVTPPKPGVLLMCLIIPKAVRSEGKCCREEEKKNVKFFRMQSAGICGEQKKVSRALLLMF